MAGKTRSIRGWFEGRFEGKWTVPAVLLGIFLIALYLRAYYPWSLAWPDGILSGGSDSYYHRRIIETCVTTGHQLTFDPMLNFPLGLTNPRPPIYQWSTCVTGVALSPLFGDVWSSVTFVFLIGTAIWGALTVFPLYFLAKEAFGKRAALLASFFLAVLPAHLQRSPATDADHDAIVLFFVVTAFFFFLKSLRVLNERRWVDNWALWTKGGRASFRAGLRGFFAENRTSVLYATLAGWSIATVALIWQGWAYAPVLLLVYFLFQILVHRFRNQDPMGILIAYGIAVGLPLLVSFPWYWLNNQIKVWYDVPFYLFIFSIGVAVIFTVTRDYPWALVVPTIVGIGGLALVIVAIFYPAVGVIFVSGAGYFVRTKAYETIAEAQPPALSQIILSFGVATYFMALFGIVWMAYGITKRRSADYLFVVVWVIAAIFMAQSAARFIFNASPAFAVSSAFVSVLLLDWLRFDDIRKTFRSLGGRRFAAFRRSVKVRHVLGSLLVIAILMPNVWYGVDASIPFERKTLYDKQVYDAFPDFWKPPGYNQQSTGGGSFFFGAFGYSLPLESQYFPAAWAWFRTQDANVSMPSQKPAFLSWWDYGFEAADAGRHPTVADNFLDGYQLAGQFITAQGENDAIALLNMRLLQGNYWANGRHFSAQVRATLTALGVPYGPLEDVFTNPDKYVAIVAGNPVKYGDWEDVQPYNAQLIFGRVEMTSRLDDNGLAEMNHVLRAETGASIRYFAVDTRLFPLDGQNTGIFYAPVKLSDHRIQQLPDGRSIPIDFFSISATTSNRGVVDLSAVQATDTVTALNIHFKDAFYNSMFYRAYAGFSPKVAGQNCNDCIPGIQSSTNQQIGNIAPMQAWDLSHFKLVYKTAYYNPYPPQDVANHTDAWTAVEYTKAQALQGKINSGQATGVVDLSPAAAIRRGVVFIKYYDGAFLNGTVALNGQPWPGVQLTVQDEFGVPHDTAVSDANGRYSVLLPFGPVHVIASTGRPDNRTLVGPTTVGDFTTTVSDDAAMRVAVDANGDGVPDWLLTHDFAVAAEALDGAVYVDANRDGKLTPGEPLLAGADVSLALADGTLKRTGRADADGHLRIDGLYAGNYNATISWEGRDLRRNVTIAKNQGPLDLAVTPQTLKGYVSGADGRHVEGVTVNLTDATNGTVSHATTGLDGLFSFGTVLPGTFDVLASKGVLESLPDQASVAATNGANGTFHNVTVYPTGTVSVSSTAGGAPLPYATLEFVQRSALRLTRLVTTDGTGEATVPLPAGTWDVHAHHYAGTALFAFVGGLTVAPGESRSFAAGLSLGATVGGSAFSRDNRTDLITSAEILFTSLAGEYRATTDLRGDYFTQLPRGVWTVQLNARDFTFHTTLTLGANTELPIAATHGARIDGSVFRSFASSKVQIQDPVPDAVVMFSTGSATFETVTGAQGTFSMALPSEGQYSLAIARDGYRPFSAPAALSPFQWQTQSQFEITAENVTVTGHLTLGGVAATDPSIPLEFREEGPGAVTALARLDGLGGYSVDLAPGRYRVVVERNETGQGDVRLELRSTATDVTLGIGDPPRALDLPLATRVRVTGTVTLGGQPRSPVVTFDGPDQLHVNATDGAYSAFLAGGTYTIAANLTEGNIPYVAFQNVVVSAPSTIALTLLQATNVTGTATYLGNPVAGVSIAFASQGGGTLRATSDSTGSYHVLVLGGSYGVSANHTASATDGSKTRYVRYSFAGSVDVVQDERVKAFNIALSRALANETLSGTVRSGGVGVSAQLTFAATATSGINATTTTGSDGSYSFPLQPGTYDVYAVAPFDRAAFVGTYALAPGGPATLDLSLSAAFQASGVTTFRSNARTASNLTFSSNLGTVSIRSDASGAFALLLPKGSYTLDAATSGTERGLLATYRGTASLSLVADAIANVELTKVVRRSLSITWDSVQAATVNAGGSAAYEVQVTNTGNDDDTYDMSASSVGFTFSFGVDKVALKFGPTGNATAVRVTITAAADAKVDHGPITIVARSEADSSVVKSVTVTLTIRGFRGLDASVSSDAPVWDGRFLNYTLAVHNRGNGAATFRVTIPNAEELAAAGWRATLLSSVGSAPTTTLDLTVDANATSKPLLRLQNAGGSSGAIARVRIVDTVDMQYDSLLTVSIQMPSLTVVGSLQAGGSGISTRAPGIDLATAAFLISLAAILAAAVYLGILRRRSR